jgi:hypothetical protein
MAKYNGSAFGSLSGKLGNAVAAKWKGIDTARSYNSQPSNPNSPAQQVQRGKMKTLVAFLKNIWSYALKNQFDQNSTGTTGWAKAIKANIAYAGQTAMAVVASVKISMGNRLQPAITSASASVAAPNIVVNFSTTVTTGQNAATDIVRAVAYNSTDNTWGIPTTTVALSTGAIPIPKPPLMTVGDIIHIYLASTDASGQETSGTSHIQVTAVA